MRKEFNILKIKEQQETKKRINEFKLKQMKTLNEQVKEEEELNNRLNGEDEGNPEFDQRDIGQMIHGATGMISRFGVR